MANKDDGMQQISVRLRQNVYDRLHEYKHQTRISKTAIIEQAIVDYLDKMEEENV
jgi:predicted transcriptional regulator